MSKKMRLLLVALLCAALVLSGCAQKRPAQAAAQGTAEVGDTASTGKKLTIVTTLFPQYDFARQLAGEKADIIMLLPPGVESHSYEPTPEDIIKINSSDLFIYTGQYMEPWAHRIIEGLSSKKVVVLDASDNVTLDKDAHEHEHEHEHDAASEEAEHHEEESHEEHVHEYDPHIWTDPNNAKTMVDNIASALVRVDPENEAYYRDRAVAYKAELDELDKEFRAIVASGNRKEIIFGGRFAFHYFVRQYGLEYEAAYDSCSKEAEPSVKVVAQLIKEIKEEKFPVIYYEELSTPKVAKSISEETGAKMLLLHSCHNVSRDEFQSGVTYISLMKQNAENLREGLK